MTESKDSNSTIAQLPLIYKTIRGERPTKEELIKLIEMFGGIAKLA